MKNVLHLQGTTLKPGQSKKTSIQHDTKGVSGTNLEAHPVQVKDWSQCTKEQVVNQLEALSKRKLVPYAKTRLNIIPFTRTRSEGTKLCAAWGIHCERPRSYKCNYWARTPTRDSSFGCDL
eukprot:12791154-Prorocentrum_lima.AAC.1